MERFDCQGTWRPSTRRAWRFYRGSGWRCRTKRPGARFADRGAGVDFVSQRVKIPPDLVEACLRSAGKVFTIYGRDRSRTAEFGAGKRNYNAIAGEALWLDEDTLTRRYAEIKDVRTACVVCDALPHINIAGAMTDPHDVPHAVQDVFVVREMIQNTTKPIVFWFNTRQSARYVAEMLMAVAGGRGGGSVAPYVQLHRAH